MNPVHVRLTEEAEEQILQAFIWYADRSTTVANRFIEDLDACFDHISNFPLAHAIKYRDLRRALLPKYPFKVFYRVDDDTAYIFAILHHNQSEEQSLSRL